MRFIFIVCIGITILLIGCKKSNETVLADGVYKGIFYRISPWKDTAQVSITISGNHYSAESNKNNYPAFCSGTFSITNSKIKFSSTCPWAANFDWSLILLGDYDFKKNGSKVNFERSYNGFIYYKDVYQLTKQ
ncbi:MAG: hypothetical protein HYX40_06815 [Sphingobacteriales bacterium]|nr:hypothetical protein [Sphingobacteriales bacterium]